METEMRYDLLYNKYRMNNPLGLDRMVRAGQQQQTPSEADTMAPNGPSSMTENQNQAEVYADVPHSQQQPGSITATERASPCTQQADSDTEASPETHRQAHDPDPDFDDADIDSDEDQTDKASSAAVDDNERTCPRLKQNRGQHLYDNNKVGFAFRKHPPKVLRKLTNCTKLQIIADGLQRYPVEYVYLWIRLGVNLRRGGGYHGLTRRTSLHLSKLWEHKLKLGFTGTDVMSRNEKGPVPLHSIPLLGERNCTASLLKKSGKMLWFRILWIKTLNSKLRPTNPEAEHRQDLLPNAIGEAVQAGVERRGIQPLGPKGNKDNNDGKQQAPLPAQQAPQQGCGHKFAVDQDLAQLLFGGRQLIQRSSQEHSEGSQREVAKATQRNLENQSKPKHCRLVPSGPSLQMSAGQQSFVTKSSKLNYSSVAARWVEDNTFQMQTIGVADYNLSEICLHTPLAMLKELPVQSEVKTDLDKDQDFKLPSHAEVHANAKPMFSSKWERAVAYHHGLYVPEKYAATKTAEDIRVAVADYSDKVHKDSPKDACKYLQIEEFRCLNVHQFESQPEVAAKKCMKWWDEVQKCQWDQAKFNAGTTYIEGPQMRRRRAYIFYPDFKYA
ncbi:unnamed protein product [Symbiodinium sp. CCMP2456]|nr:unnamed protein product [Symbiodinium sp. CCMP2456]